ncbi:MAG: ABC transporter ATP-binding protein [Endomicrobium sp.]|jgi:iron complex transport system ATP-binding protein|nr:ABC transporter ATP-binding protein [Endomicrobium sp.]
MVQIKNIYAGYFDREVLKNISFDVKQKDFFGIIGKNGAGKSTLLKIFSNLLKSYKGDIFIDNKNLASFKSRELAKRLSFLPQHSDMSLPFSVFEFIMFARFPYMNMFKFPSKNDYKAVEKAIDFLDISNLSERKVIELSGGEKQKVLIAQVLAQETDIIVFDEPTSHLDIGSQNNILKLFVNLNEKHNKTIILTLHDLNAAGEFCNKLLLLENGFVCRCGTPKEVLNYKDIERVYNTSVVVKINPISNKPYVIPVSKKLKI